MDSLLVKTAIQESIRIKENILSDEKIVLIGSAAEAIINAIKRGNKVLFCGNGGSASDSQHLAAELSGKFRLERNPLPADVLGANFSYLTATANDYSFEDVFSRDLKSKAGKGDVLVAISTSGKSLNVIKALETAREMEVITLGLTGESGGRMRELCDYLISVPSSDTARIQEIHILLGHVICEIVEKEIFKT